MDRRLLFGATFVFGILFPTNAQSPESYLRQQWYNIEFIVFEKIPSPPTPELVTNVVEKRILPANTLGMLLSDEELDQIGEFSRAVNFDAVVDELFFDNPWYVTPGTDESSTIDEQPELQEKYLDGCWMHVVDLDEETFQKFESHDDWTARKANTLSEKRTRDPRLPDWLPDIWQTFDRNLIDLAKTLGLCDEDVTSLIDKEYLDFLKPAKSQDLEELLTDEPANTLTSGRIHDVFDEYELELSHTALTPQSNRLNLQQTVNRLQNSGYRIIDHFSWHQDGKPRGSESHVLVQFGQHFGNGFREVEGTVAFSIARFLHLKVNLWRFVPAPKSYDPSETDFESPIFFNEIQERRRLALGEIHYFDHPKFGVLVQIQRVPIPDELKTLVEQLNSSS